VFLLLGNKSDLKDQVQVPEEEARKWAKDFGMKFYECSAKTGYNVNEAYEGMGF
jgi:hypothetical protein